MNNKNTTNTIQDFYYKGKFSSYKPFKIKPNTNPNITDVVDRNEQLKEKLKQDYEKKYTDIEIRDKQEIGGLETGLIVTHNTTKDKRYIKFGMTEEESEKVNGKDIQLQKRFNKEKKHF